jgi:UDP-2,3-diacylglucosamine hydrolase
MIDAVFISDLHLHPDRLDISKQFELFLKWVETRTRTLYILGDFFHVWAGDDTSNAFSHAIAARLALLSQQGIKIYFIRGNRDFLLGDAFFKQAQITPLEEPALITLDKQKVMLVHGDRYCTKDKTHQWFRRLTRNRWFPTVFMTLPKQLRTRIVMGVRLKSETNTYKKPAMMQVVSAALTRHLAAYGVDTVIHGHTHQPGLTTHHFQAKKYQQYVLSDWDAPPQVLCYNKSTGFNFILTGECDGRTR